ncbi:MAG: cyclic nucleotide-binding domain-containing protein [Gammaproteobacteria bacterium]|nr:cyclic nucleotide-binding domain-containing protein [Gammaproteobacteria bacterium]
MSDKLIGILERSKLFSGFSLEQLEQVVLHLQPKIVTFKSGEQVYKKGKPADRCWLIQSGNLTVERLSLRTPFRHMIYSKSSVTGIQGLADPGSKRAVTMIAEDNVKLIEITYEGIAQLDNEAQIQLWKNVSKLLLRKLAICLSRESKDV